MAEAQPTSYPCSKYQVGYTPHTWTKQMAKASAMLASTPAEMTAVRSPIERLRSRFGSSAAAGREGGEQAGSASALWEGCRHATTAASR